MFYLIPLTLFKRALRCGTARYGAMRYGTARYITLRNDAAVHLFWSLFNKNVAVRCGTLRDATLRNGARHYVAERCGGSFALSLFKRAKRGEELRSATERYGTERRVDSFGSPDLP